MGRFADKLFIDPENWRAGVLRLLLGISLIFGLIIYIPSFIISVASGLYGLAFVDTLAIAVIFGLLYFSRIPYHLRSLIFLAVCYALGASLLMNVGSISQIYLFGFSMVATLLLGLRPGIAATVISSATVFAIGAMGIVAPEMVNSIWGHDLKSWVVISINFALVSFLLTFAIGAIIGALEEALSRAIAVKTSLAEEKTLLRTLIDTVPDVVFTKDKNGRFQLYNPAMLDLVGLPADTDVTGKTVFDLYPRPMADSFNEDDQRVLNGSSVFNKEEQSLRTTGEPQWYLTRKVPLRNPEGEIIGLIGTSRDITDRKRFEAELSRLLMQLQVQIERLPLGYMLTDHHFNFKRWNPAAEQMFGYTESEVIGKNPFELVIPEDRHAEAVKTFEELRAGRMESHAVTTNVTKDGRVIMCEWHHTPMYDPDGSFAGLLSIVQDITERQLLEEQLQQSQRIDAIGQLAGGVAHDFNNLLTIINGYSEMILRTTPENEPNRKRLEEIKKAGERSAVLTSQLLSFSRKQVLAPKVLVLNDVVRDAESMLSRIIGEDIEMSLSLSEDLHPVKVDPARFEQVLINLVINSRDAMPLGGKLTIETRNVRIGEDYARLHSEILPGNYALVTVTDNGCGIPDDVKRRIFEPYFTTKSKGKGTGLGLSVAFGNIRQSNGNIEVYSEPDVGTSFKIYLPAINRTDVEVEMKIESAEMPTGNESILVVEDEQGVRGLICSTLTDLGYTISEAGSGEEAFSVYQEMDQKPDLVITDVVMPGMGGRLLSEKLLELAPELPILFMSGYTDDAVVRHGILHEKVNFIQKPFAPSAMARKVREVLDQDS